tara:strand:- start:272 stop:484 length:213 start_codon:yes stop_codon:yes gene_type:complete
MKRILLYIIVFVAANFYVDINTYESIEPLGSIWFGIRDILNDRQYSTTGTSLLILGVVYILFDKLLKKLD